MTTGKLDTRLEPTGPKFTDYSLEDERARKADPSFYGRMLTGPIPPVITHRTPWKDVYPKEPDEYDRYTQEHLGDEKKFDFCLI